MSIVKPIVHCLEEDKNFLSNLQSKIEELPNGKGKILLKYPSVYIHNWKKSENASKNLYEIYVGESNDVISRTKEHYKNALDSTKWQNHLLNDGTIPKMYIIGHPHFNKSLTLDIENRLIHYISSMPTINKIHNGRGNPQNQYYPIDEFEEIFSMIWKELRSFDKNLFLSESEIQDSAIFKASPLHKLTEEQINAKKIILEKVYNAINNNLTGQLIFVNGEAGTGKTVLNSSTFYELLDQAEDSVDKQISVHLMVNHDEQICVYKEIAKKLKLLDNYGDDIVSKPTTFINNHSSTNVVDVAFVDEAHLLLTQGKQSYQGSNQLQDIIDRSRVTIVMFDENQVLTTEQYWEKDILTRFKELSLSQDNYIVLKNQLRMNCSQSTINWIDAITKESLINDFEKDETGYEVKIFDTPRLLHQEIIKKSKMDESKLSRIIATYDWEYSSTKEPEDKRYWGVEIGDWFLPWNRELSKKLSKSQKKMNKNLAWAEQKQTIDECGSTFTIQGFDLAYAGLIIGPSVKYIDGKIVFDPNASYNEKAVRNRTLSNGTKQKFGEELLKNELRVLLTRGVKGLYIYACDEALRNRLKEVLKEEK